MGFRYRKSINLGGGFRINLSKSGVGYSWGTKGYRITKPLKVQHAELTQYQEQDCPILKKVVGGVTAKQVIEIPTGHRVSQRINP